MKLARFTPLLLLFSVTLVALPAAADHSRFVIIKDTGNERLIRSRIEDRIDEHHGHRRYIEPHPTIRSLHIGINDRDRGQWHRLHRALRGHRGFHGSKRFDRGHRDHHDYRAGYREGYRDGRRCRDRSRKY